MMSKTRMEYKRDLMTMNRSPSMVSSTKHRFASGTFASSASSAALSSNDAAGLANGTGNEKKKLKVQFIQNTPNNQAVNLNLQINPKTWPSLKVNDLIEINANLVAISGSSSGISSVNNGPSGIASNATVEDESSPFLLQVVASSFTDQIPIDTIRIDQAASSAPFFIKNFSFVTASKVEKSVVMLDLVELLFKEQYLNGYDMLRVKKSMKNSCVYLKKNIEFCSMRLSVKEMWALNGDSVTCGYVGEKTRLVFRSQSAMCTIYIQMSREMWEFDVNGEMYHEKVINFLSELFANWKNQQCTHDVTIALFSRVFYEAKSQDEFPDSVKADLKRDHKSRFYEDFYRIVYQNERYEDWTPTLIILKRLIKEYRDYVLNYHKRHLSQQSSSSSPDNSMMSSSRVMPDAQLSSAAEGNFLETLNLSSSVFERHFIDRPFDRTGMMSLVITPGNGIFQVSRELTKITKERVIDNGIGSDLVCLGEQPLHAVPLFKYDTADSFDIPNWINLSFFKSSETVRYCNSSFLPTSKIRVKSKNFSSSLDPDAILPGYNVDKSSYLKSLEETDNIFENQKNNSVSDFLGSNKRMQPRLNTVSFLSSTSSLKAKLNRNNLSQVSLNGGQQLQQQQLATQSQSVMPTSTINANMLNGGGGETTTALVTTSSGIKINKFNDHEYPLYHQNMSHSNALFNNDACDDFDIDSSVDESDNESSSTQQHSSISEESTSTSSQPLSNISNNGPTNSSSSTSSSSKKFKPKVNPFMPISIRQRMSSQRRPWAHIYPLRSDGTPMLPNQTPSRMISNDSMAPAVDQNGGSGGANGSGLTSSSTNSAGSTGNLMLSAAQNNGDVCAPPSVTTRISPDSTLNTPYHYQQPQQQLHNQIRTSISQNNGENNKQLALRHPLLRNVKVNVSSYNIEESMLTMKTGVAWKSITIPASMPLTTDYYPSKATMASRFALTSSYDLILEDVREQYGFTTYDNKKISVAQVFNELVGHRLAMGFQIVVPKNFFNYNTVNSSTSSTSSSSSSQSGGSNTASTPGGNGSSGGKEMSILSTTPTNSSMMQHMHHQQQSSAQSSSSSSSSSSSASNNFLGVNFMCDLSMSQSVYCSRMPKSIRGYYRLSLGRIFHEIFHVYVDSSEYVRVEIYVPKEKKVEGYHSGGGTTGGSHKQQLQPSHSQQQQQNAASKIIEYKYRFQVPDSKTYDISICEITRKNIESVKWNLIDSYICIQGNASLLTPSHLQQCWRQRLYVIPIMYVSNKSISNNSSNANSNSNNNMLTNDLKQQLSTDSALATSAGLSSTSLNNYLLNFTNLSQSQIPASMIQQREKIARCDIYARKTPEELRFFRDFYFIKFMEGLNKLNRADERRSYSKATLAYIESLSPNSNTDNCVAVATILNALFTSFSSASVGSLPATASSSNLAASGSASGSSLALINAAAAAANQNKNQMIGMPALGIKQQQSTPLLLKSPKKFIYPLLTKFRSCESSEERESLRAEIVSLLTSEYKQAMLNSSQGMPFIQNRTDIPMNCFISAEAVWWCMEHIEDVACEADAIVFMQVMADFDLVRHISDHHQMESSIGEIKIFIHGFYLYYIISQEASHHVFTKDYCEVGFCDIEVRMKQDNNNETSSTSTSTTAMKKPTPNKERFKLVAVKDLLPDSTNTLPVTANEMFFSYMSLLSEYSDAKFTDTSSDAILKLVNVDVDPARKSDRVEWASAVYRSHYHQLCAFELEIQWEVATGSLLSELVSGWSKLSNRFNYHVVPAPVDPFAMPLQMSSDPLRGPVYIRLNLNCLMKDENVLFERLIDEKYKSCLDELFAQSATSMTPEPSSAVNGASTTFKLDSSSPSTSCASSSDSSSGGAGPNSTIDATLKFLNENAPEFIQFLVKKHANAVYKRIQDDPDFIKFEFLEFVEYERIIRLQYFQEAILEKFGFVRNAAITKTFLSDEEFFFIHSSGGMFVFIPNYYNNYSIRSRHTSSNTTTLSNALNNTTTMTTTTTTTTSMQQPPSARSPPLPPQQPQLKQVNNRPSLMEEEADSIDSNKMDTTITTTTTTSSAVNNITNGINTTSSSTTRTSLNTPLSNSYISGSNLNGVISSSAASVAAGVAGRERSHTKSQHLQFLKWNPYYSSGGLSAMGSGNGINQMDTSTSGGVGEQHTENERAKTTDLLFKPKSSSQKSFTKYNEIQHQQQREQMLLQPLMVPSSTSYQRYYSSQLSDGGVGASSAAAGKKMPFYTDAEAFVGYLWSWNFMLGKRWRSQFTGDEQFQDNMLADFRLFCSNQDGRLEKFYQESKDFLK